MGINRALRYTIISGLFLLPLLALVVTSSLYFPYITGKNFLFRTIIEIIFVCYAALAFRDPAYRPKWKSPIVISLCTFIFIIFLADLFGEYFFKSFWSNFERMEGFITFLHLLVFFFIAAVIFNSEKLWRRWFHASFAVSIIMGFIAIYQHFHSAVERPDAQLGNSTYLGALMLFNVFLLLFYLLRSIKARRPSWPYAAAGYILAIIFDFYILFLSGTRGAFLGLVVGFTFIAVVLAFFEKEQKAIKRAGMALLILAILGMGFSVVFKNSNFVKNSFFLSRFTAPISAVLTFDINGFVEKEGRGRLLIWQAALNGFKEKPILGWGQDNFNYIFNKDYTPQMYTEEQWFDRSHNVILDWLTQGGILGLLSYLSLFGFLIYAIWKKTPNNFSLEDKTVLTGLLIAYFIHNFFVFDNLTSYILFFAILAWVNQNQWPAVNNTINNKEVKRINIHPDIANYALTPIVLIIAALIFYFAVWAPYRASAFLINALTLEQGAQSGNVQAVSAAASSFQTAISYNTFGSPETREQFLEYLPAVAASSLDDQTKNSIIQNGLSEMQKQLKATPNDARYFLFYGFTLDRLGLYQQAETYLNQAHELSPKKQTILFELGLNYISQRQFAQGLAVLKDAYDSAPEYQEAKIYYAIGLIYANDNRDADAIIATIDPKALAGDNRLLKAYFDTKQYQKIVSIYQANIVADPTNVQNYLGATAFLLAINNRVAAIAELQKAIDTFSKISDPNAQGIVLTLKSYISQIQAGKNPLPLSQ
jgi:O-antigen ligase/tetratricopeptide (TPR) repeat protein